VTSQAERDSYETFGGVAAAATTARNAGKAQSNGGYRTPSKLTLRDAAEAWLEGAELGEIQSMHRRPHKTPSREDRGCRRRPM
jgi:hypothetical protein